MPSSHLRTNTGSTSCCLLCRGTENCRLLEENERNDGESASIAFKMLLRYFKVDMRTKIVDIGDKLCEANLPVWLCEDCSSVTNDFLDLYKALEGIRLQLDLCLRQLHGFMEKAEKDPNRVREYKKRVNSGSLEALMESNILDNLREEMLKKVSRKLKSSLPRIVLEKSKRKLEVINEVHDNTTLSCMEQEVAQEDTEAEMVESEPLLSTEENVAKTRKEETVNFENNISMETEDHWRLKCIPCGKMFSSKTSLERHQFNKHSTLIFRKNSDLPPNMSEYQLDTVVRDILRPVKHSVIQCPFCGAKGFESKYKVMPHLVEMHLPEIIARVEQLPEVNVAGGDFAETKKSFWNCVPCGEWFHERNTLLEHQFQNHMIQVLKDEKENVENSSEVTLQRREGEESEGNLLKS